MQRTIEIYNDRRWKGFRFYLETLSLILLLVLVHIYAYSACDYNAAST